MKGFNSYVANLPREQYQLDLAHIQPMMKSIMEDKDPDNIEQAMNIPYRFCFICVDVFSKRVFAKAQKTGQQEETKQSVIGAFNDMGIPKQIYTDRGTEFQALGPLLKENNVEHIQTRTHAVFAERWIRFLKGRLDEKLDEAYQASGWNVLLPSFLKHYNENYKNDTTKMTPKDAEQDKNAMTVKANILLKAQYNRKYPPLDKDDEVKVYKKPEKKQYEKSYNNKWIGPRKVTKTSMTNNTKYYHVGMDGIDTPLLRYELLKI